MQKTVIDKLKQRILTGKNQKKHHLLINGEVNYQTIALGKRLNGFFVCFYFCITSASGGVETVSTNFYTRDMPSIHHHELSTNLQKLSNIFALTPSSTHSNLSVDC